MQSCCFGKAVLKDKEFFKNGGNAPGFVFDAPLNRKDTNMVQYHFLRRWLVFLVHFYLPWEGGIVNLDKKSQTGGVFSSKNAHGFPRQGWEGFTCGLILKKRVNITAGRWRTLWLMPKQKQNLTSPNKEERDIPYPLLSWTAETCFYLTSFEKRHNL